jgi:NAD(P)-dependent dehydrogenase (short-subunit alcohol dehydrogenase family)
MDRHSKDARTKEVEMGRLAGKVAIVTGAAKGIGGATAKRMAEQGARVALTDVDDRSGEELTRALAKTGEDVGYWHLDVTRGEAVAAAFADIHARFGRLDVLVNNAGIAGDSKPTHELTEQEWEKVQAVNVKGVFLCTKAAIPLMRRNGGGSIVNVSSIYGIIGAPDLPSYHASKGAVRLMAKTDALLYAADGIRVNSVHPGYIWTPLVEQLALESGQPQQEFREELACRHPVGRVGEPDDIAHGIVYLASDEARFVTGSELVIDGGYTAR